MSDAEIDSILERLIRRHPRRIDLTLDRIRYLLAVLGHPEQALPPIIHVAGTNGKGSTIGFMRSILEAGGNSVHVYTSPHLVRINERFRIGRKGGGLLVSDSELIDALAVCERAIGTSPITVFEIETAAAFLLFARNPADVLLLEVGLGGRLDATNVVAAPLVSVITPISMDHADSLGDSLEKIAGEKAGILRAGTPAVIGKQLEGPVSIISRRAQELATNLYIEGKDWTMHKTDGRVEYGDQHGRLELPSPSLVGPHQIDNAGIAVAALRAGHFALTDAAFEQGLLRTAWPGRMQRLSAGALVARAPAGSEVWLDGGHNPDGGRAIAAALTELNEKRPRPVVLIVGMLTTKDFGAFLQNFSGIAQGLIVVPLKSDKSVPTATIAQVARSMGIAARESASLVDSLNSIPDFDFEVPPRVLITGSLYLVGQALAVNGTLPD